MGKGKSSLLLIKNEELDKKRFAYTVQEVITKNMPNCFSGIYVISTLGFDDGAYYMTVYDSEVLLFGEKDYDEDYNEFKFEDIFKSIGATDPLRII